MTAELRVFIVDDEAAAREGLRLRLERETGVLIAGEYGDAADAIAALEDERPHLLFLDIEMPRIDGFALLERISHDPTPMIVFVTAHDRHAVRAFGARVLDYLLKPVEQERLRETLARAREQRALMRDGRLAEQVRGLLGRETLPPALAGSARPRHVERIAVNRDGVIQFVNASDVDWIDAAGDEIILNVGTVKHVVRTTMGEILSTLDPARFARIHRSTIVNVGKITELQPYFHGEYMVVLQGGMKLKLSRGYRDAVSRLLGLRSI